MSAADNKRADDGAVIIPASGMTRRRGDTRAMVRVAQMYYGMHLTQEAIGKRLGMSRFKVGRLLDRAVREDIVRIEVVHVLVFVVVAFEVVVELVVVVLELIVVVELLVLEQLLVLFAVAELFDLVVGNGLELVVAGKTLLPFHSRLTQNSLAPGAGDVSRP